MEVPILDEEPVVVIVQLRHVRIYVNLPVGRLCRNILVHEQNVVLAIKCKSNRPKLNLIAINITLISIKETKNFDKLTIVCLLILVSICNKLIFWKFELRLLNFLLLLIVNSVRLQKRVNGFSILSQNI